MHKAMRNRLGAFLLTAGLTFACAEDGAKARTHASEAGQGNTVRESGSITTLESAANRTAKSTAGSEAEPAVRGPGKMRVEEPLAGTYINPASESMAWKRSHSQGLTAEQKRAFRERKEKMGEMIALIREKRMAMVGADSDKRAVLVRELHSLILEKAPESQADAASARTKSGGAIGKKETKKNPSDAALRKKRELMQLMESRKEGARKARSEKDKSAAEKE